MNGLPLQPGLLDRDRKLFLELTPQEADVWISRLFDRIRPRMHILAGLVLQENEQGAPLNLEAMMVLAASTVREVAVEMADALLDARRQEQIYPLLSAYCDELLAQGRALDATFVQQGLIEMRQCKRPSQNILLVEICLRAIHHQVSLISGSPRMGPRAH